MTTAVCPAEGDRHLATVATLFGEPEAEAFAEAIEQDPVRLISAASVPEAAIVVKAS
jgi:uncharacterized protein with PIN domain